MTRTITITVNKINDLSEYDIGALFMNISLMTILISVFFEITR
jgi:hypothetical protein